MKTTIGITREKECISIDQQVDLPSFSLFEKFQREMCEGTIFDALRQLFLSIQSLRSTFWRFCLQR